MSRSARRSEQLALAAELRSQGISFPDIGRTLRDRYGINARRAQRIARGWTQEDAATAWSARWTDDPKTFKNVSYWENWPSKTGHAPSLQVLDRLAQLYGCNVADLVADWGEHASVKFHRAENADPEAFAWQVEHLDLQELTRSISNWAERIADRRRRAMLLKLSTAASLAANTFGAPEARSATGPPTLSGIALTGLWTSRYGYTSTSRNAEFAGEHHVSLRLDGGRLIGKSEPDGSGSRLSLDLAVEGSLVSGTWTERTSPTGHYRAATFHGVLQLVLDPTGQSMAGQWLGISRRYVIKSGPWRLEPPQPEGAPVTSATTTDSAAISPDATMANSA